MKTFSQHLHSALLFVACLALSGCPLVATSGGGGNSPSAVDVPQEPSEVISSDQPDPNGYYRRRIFIDGREVYFDFSKRESSISKGEFQAKKKELVSKIRMLFTDPNVINNEAGLHPRRELIINILKLLFGWGQKGFVVNRVLLNVLNVEVKPDDSDTWKRVVDFGEQGHVIDLMGLAHGTYFDIGSFQLDPGKYSRMRLNLGLNNQVEVDEGNGLVLKPLATPSNAHERIDFITPFEVLQNGLTTLTVDFDVGESIRRKINGKYWIKPNLKVASVSTSAAITKMISAQEGGVLGVFGEIMISFPPGALAEDTQVSLNPIYRLAPHETPDLFILGHEYIIEPRNLALLEPATVSVGYDPLYVPSLALKPESLGVRVFDELNKTWSPSGAATVSHKSVAGPIHQLGRIAVGGEPASNAGAGAGCVGYSDAVQIQDTKKGLDLQYFAAACNQHNLCYQHGYRTYGKEAGACVEDLATQALSRCEDLCRADSLFGKNCSQLSEEEIAQAVGNGLSATLYENCKVLAGKMAQEARDTMVDRYPGNDQSTCKDYDGKGVSCQSATCALTVDKSEVPYNLATDLQFSLQVAGSIQAVDFDGSAAYRHEGLATPISKLIVIEDSGRVLTEPRVFTASVSGPGGVVSCSVSVDVKKVVEPCTISISPAEVKLGEVSNLTLKAASGYDIAYLDLVKEGELKQVALQPGDGDGSRSFFAFLRPRATRSFTGKVVDAFGIEKTCSGMITVFP